jgi:hypothetical protein
MGAASPSEHHTIHGHSREGALIRFRQNRMIESLTPDTQSMCPIHVIMQTKPIPHARLSFSSLM